jgi:hypothetical protein
MKEAPMERKEGLEEMRLTALVIRTGKEKKRVANNANDRGRTTTTSGPLRWQLQVFGTWIIHGNGRKKAKRRKKIVNHCHDRER